MSRASHNLARFDLVSIKLAVLCAEQGSLSSAARVANMSLSRASHRLSTLEHAVGRALFLRHCGGLTPTAEGRLLVQHGRALLATVARLNDDLSHAQSTSWHADQAMT